MSQKTLLSICIPTYNRATILRRTLESLFQDKDYDENLIEVIVSDNNSEDHTSEVLKEFPSVIYNKNDQNLIGQNFEILLDLAKGVYLKILNDTFIFKEGQLGLMLKRIKNSDPKKEALFFFPNSPFTSNCSKIVSDVNQLITHCSFYTTWTYSTGFWKKDYEEMRKTPNPYTQMRFPQLYWMFGIVKNRNLAKIFFDDIFNIQHIPKKGGYNFYRTFVNDYLDILAKQSLRRKVYQKEKYRLLKYFISPWTIAMLIHSNDFTFSKKNGIKIVFNAYKYEFYFYVISIKTAGLFWIKKTYLKFQNEK